jgi:hypothetical protein
VRRLLPLIPALLLLAGCGGDDSAFTADQFVGAVNQRGASLELGPELRSTRPEAQVFALELGAGDAAGGDTATEGTEAGGSIAVMADADAGFEEYRRCEQAVSILCYRADNIVLFIEGEVAPAALARLENALRVIAGETSG